MTNTHDKLTIRIKSLLNLAEHPDTPEHEADAAMSKAQELMLKHAIDEYKVRCAGGTAKAEEPTRRDFHVKPMSGRAGIKALRSMLNGLGSLNRVVVLKHMPQSNTCHELIGFEADITFVINLYSSIERQMDAAFDRSDFKGANARKEFYWGFAMRVVSRLRADMAQLAEGHVDETALALRDVDAIVKAKVAVWYPKIRTASGGNYGQHNAAAKAAGSAAGATASLAGARGEL